MKIYAETERFILREIVPTDLDGLYELDSDPAVHTYLGSKPVTNKQQVAEAIHFIRQQYIYNGIGRWAIVNRTTNEFVGWSGLKFVTTEINNHINFYDLGYRLLQKYWGQGVATETAIATLDYAFNNLHVSEVYAMTDSNNIASQNVLKKTGFSFAETFYDDGNKLNWYKLDRNDFVNRTSRIAPVDQKT